MHRIAHRRLRPLLARRLGTAPRVSYAAGSVNEALDLVTARDPADALVVATWNLMPALTMVTVAAQRAPEVPLILSGWAADPDFIDSLRTVRPVSHPRLVVARGEVEAALADAIFDILTEGGFPVSAMIRHGLAVSTDGSSWESRGTYREVEDVTTLPSPYLEGEARVAESEGVALIEVARGCMNRCRFCLSCNFKTPGLRIFAHEQIRSEIAEAARQGAGNAGLMCAALDHDKATLRAVVEAYEQLDTGSRPLVDSTIHTAYLDDEALELASRLPWHVMIIGLQSTNPEALRIMSRSADLEDYRAKIEAISKFHVPVVELILGLPGDTLAGFQSNMQYALSLPAKVEVYPLRFSPGSHFTHNRETLGLEPDFANGDRVLSTPTFPASDIQRATDWLRELAAKPWTHRARYLGFNFRPLFEDHGPHRDRPAPATAG